MKIDETDKKILEILQDDGRITNAKLAATIGISPNVSDPQVISHVRGACPHDCPDTCSLITTVHERHPEARGQVGILAVGLLATAPARIAEQVDVGDQ